MISNVFGQKDENWFDAGRQYHADGCISEQRIRLTSTPKCGLSDAAPGKV
jgi:hypothetical protein